MEPGFSLVTLERPIPFGNKHNDPIFGPLVGLFEKAVVVLFLILFPMGAYENELY